MIKTLKKIRAILLDIQKDIRIIRTTKQIFFDKKMWNISITDADKKLNLESYRALERTKNNFTLLKDIFTKEGLSDLEWKSKTGVDEAKRLIEHYFSYKLDTRKIEEIIDKIRQN